MNRLLPLLLAPGCIFIFDGEPDLRECEDIRDEIDAELADLQACTADRECGQVLTGTSCGCTRDLVAREGADASRFYELIDLASDRECDAGTDSTCDCPEAYGFECTAENVCAWDYTEGTYYPDCRASRGDEYEVIAASISGDTLTVDVGYGGGCATHDFTLCWPDQAFAESDPVQATVEPFHDAHDDECDMYIEEPRTFDLAPLKQAWQDAYHATSGTILVHVGGQTLEYSF
jgi:hypothetical protein